MILRPYRSEDLALMPPREEERELLEIEPEMAQARLHGPGYTLWDGECPVAAAGIILLRAGVGEAWLRGTPRILSHRVGCGRAVRGLLDRLIATYELRRTQALIRADNASALRFARWLGFRYEGLLENFGLRGEPYVMLARCRPEKE